MMFQLSLIGSVQTPPSGSSLLLVLTSDQCLFLTPPAVGAMTMTPSTPSVLLLLLHHLLSPVSSQTVDPSVADLTNRNLDFAARLYRAVASRTDDNVFLSPFTLTTGLTALLNATSGPTQDQLLQGLTLTGLDPQTLPGRSRPKGSGVGCGVGEGQKFEFLLLSDLFQTLRTTILQGGTAMNLQQGVAVFPAQSFQVSSSYLDLVQTKFGGTAQSLAYTSPEQAIDTINRWAQEQTGDQIKELVTNLDPQTQLLLATAASYQGTYHLLPFVGWSHRRRGWGHTEEEP